ncbi:Protein of unknown function [Gryllus bimaculatus]|nr:Protein of unknown function [Gryllus bimaculatus]
MASEYPLPSHPRPGFLEGAFWGGGGALVGGRLLLRWPKHLVVPKGIAYEVPFHDLPPLGLQYVTPGFVIASSPVGLGACIRCYTR